MKKTNHGREPVQLRLPFPEDLPRQELKKSPGRVSMLPRLIRGLFEKHRARGRAAVSAELGRLRGE